MQVAPFTKVKYIIKALIVHLKAETRSTCTGVHTISTVRALYLGSPSLPRLRVRGRAHDIDVSALCLDGLCCR